MCDMSNDRCTTGPVAQRGDLLLCPTHAADLPANVGRLPGEVRCQCGYFRPVGTPCGEPCL